MWCLLLLLQLLECLLFLPEECLSPEFLPLFLLLDLVLPLLLIEQFVLLDVHLAAVEPIVHLSLFLLLLSLLLRILLLSLLSLYLLTLAHYFLRGLSFFVLLLARLLLLQ
jgi:hypothetical protein